MKKILFLTLLSYTFGLALAQQNPMTDIRVSSYAETSPDFYKLLKNNTQIDEDDVLNEKLLDLVEVTLTDSLVTKKKQRHKALAARAWIWIIGYRWQRISTRKEKFVGTAKRPVVIPLKERFTEYDVIWDLVPHLKTYKDVAYQGYNAQKQHGKDKRNIDYSQAPFVYPNSDSLLHKYFLHCELTPPKAYRPMLNQYFFPCIRGYGSTENHQNFRSSLPSIGLYGVLASDCNNECHPEIHPYEWIWWLDLSEEKRRTWLFGLFKEGSNRFPQWSADTRVGTISLPFVIDTNNKSELHIKIESLVFDTFNKEKLKELELPSEAETLNFIERSHRLKGSGLGDIAIKINQDNSIKDEGIKYWIDRVNYDEKNKLVTGYLNFAIAVENLYTAKITFD